MRGVATYRVEKSPAANGPWTPLTTPTLLAGSHTESVPAGERPWYRVASVDDAGRAGPSSEPVSAG